MEVEDALIAHNPLASNTPSPAVSEDEDAVNTESARIYFGPITSPEKKFALQHDPTRRTPIRRSKRLSTAPRLIQHMNLQDAEPSDGTPAENTSERSGSETPDAFEEPSSVLASKILRASVNPSPPPRSPSPTAIDTAIATRNKDNDPPNDSISPLLAQRALSFSPPPAQVINTESESLLPKVDPSQSDAVTGNEVIEQDLITFDTSNTIDTPIVPPLPETPPNARNPETQGMVTVDDLLFSSPMKPIDSSFGPPPTLGPLKIPATRTESMIGEVTSSVDDERRVLQVLTDEGIEAPATPLIDISETTVPDRPSSPIIQVDSVPGLDETLLTGTSTPLRRSSRPRRSCSPLVVPLTSLPPPKSAQKANDVSPIMVGPARRKSVKGKEREIVVVSSETEDEPPTQPITRIRLVPIAEDSLSRRSRSPQRRTVSSHIRLGSLSPTSAVVLSQILPVSSEGQDASESGTGAPAEAPSVLPPSTPQKSAPRPQTPPPSSSPSQGAPVSPSKLLDVTRTPARRIPIAQALREGTVSPQKLLALPSASTADSQPSPFIRQSLDDPTRSPAKRVLLPQAFPSASKPPPLRLQSSQLPTPSRPSVFRSRSEEPRPLVTPKNERSTSLEPPRRKVPALTLGKDGFFKRPPGASSGIPSAQRLKPLPHPIIPSHSRIPSSIPEGDENQEVAEATVTKLCAVSPPKSSPTKPSSSLRQPTSRVETKIPRIGAKPYARPALTRPVIAKPAKPPSKPTQLQFQPILPKPTVSTPAPSRSEQPIRMRKATGKPVVCGSSSDDQSGTNAAGPGPSTSASRATMASSTGIVPPRPEVITLKRKREDIGKASPPGVKPVVLVRRVQSTMNDARKAASPSPLRSPLKQKVARDANETAPKIQMRRAIGAPKIKAATPSPPHTVVEHTLSRLPAVDSGLLRSPGPHPVLAATQEETSSKLSSPPNSSPPIPNESPEPATHPSEIPSQSTPTSIVPEAPQEPSEPSTSTSRGVRRTTRTRNKSLPPSDVFGTIVDTQPVGPRRRTRAAYEITPFGMSAQALRSLTSANTQRNQDYVVKLETEVVRVEGKRPDSPTTKVKTSLEKQKEEKVVQRQERAERRARRSGDPDATADSAADVTMDTVDFEGSDTSAMNMERESEGMPMKHRRGPGDDEDYETPPRPERAIKRGRLEEQGGEEKNEKRVKWDRGLATTVYLDDGLPNPSRKHREEVMKRGCLAPTAKTLRLDTLGNVLNADVPLTGLVVENIVVKKFVYDDDIPPETVPAPAKATRSKSKKAKS